MRRIYGQMVPEGANVTESAMLRERGSDSEREVDILVEHEIAGTRIRMAVECRDRARTDSIEWIDGLVGKHRDLDVDTVAAVNKSGFSEPAARKAAARGIETRTLEKALDANWPEGFIGLGTVKVTHRTFLQEAWVKTDPPIAGQQAVEPSASVTDGEGNVLGTLSEAIMDIFERKAQPAARQHVNDHFLDLFETLADLKKKLLLTEHPITPPPVFASPTPGGRGPGGSKSLLIAA
jgi:hypothetical protein